ncbi:MAG: flagellin [Thiohalomonadaceae bacterium]
MPQIINTNIMSLNSQRNLNTSQTALQTSLQRLSSGLRINSAKDDAAGLAISERFTTQIRGLNQAMRNANDGISLAQTAEGALSEVNNNLQRIRELAVQSVNATNSASDRAALDQEVQQRIAEIERIASQTNFNGQKILDGSFGTAAFQVGANVGETITLNLTTGMKSTQMGQIASATGTAVTNAVLTDGGLTVAVGTGAAVSVGASVAGTEAGQSNYSAWAKANAINNAGVSGLTATAANSHTGAFSTITNADATSTYELTINGVAIFSGADNIAAGASLTAADVAAQVNLYASQTGVSASVSGTDLTFTTVDGRDTVIAETITQGAGATLAGTGIAATSEGEVRGTVTLSASDNIVMTGQFADIGHAATISKDSVTLNSVDVLNEDNANETIQRVDSALTAVSSLRSTFGAIQNRFESTIANLSATTENLTASRSRIQDTDFAAETANLTRAQILQQAGVAMLAQANQLPQNVLSLLR